MDIAIEPDTSLPFYHAHHAHWTKLRHDLHAHPELRFEENRSADLVARELGALGYTTVRGLGKTGVVASLPVGVRYWVELAQRYFQR
jgi:hippurate hydrolase